MRRLFISKQVGACVHDQAAQMGYQFDEYNMLKITLSYSAETSEAIRDIGTQEADVVISSRNAVLALMQIFGETGAPPYWNIFTINGATYQGIQQWYGHDHNVKAMEKSIRHLIPHIPPVHTIHHVAGSATRPELDAFCREKAIALRRWVVYTSEKCLKKVDTAYDAYFFCSPRSAEAFFEKNLLDTERAVMVSIGPSTTEALQQFQFKYILESEQPTIMDMLTTYYDYDQE